MGYVRDEVADYERQLAYQIACDYNAYLAEAEAYEMYAQMDAETE